MSDLVMRKRPAMRAGEIGLFIDAQPYEDEFARIKQGADVVVEATQSRNIRQHRLFWGLAGKIAESGVLGDVDERDVVDYLLLKCKHVRYVTNRHRDGVETTPIVKSIRFAAMDQTAFDRLFNRALFIVTSEILPDMPEGDLRAEVEKMAGVSTPEPEAKPKAAPKQRRPRATDPKPVSVIPVDDTPPGAPADDTPSSPSASAAPAPPSSPAAIGDRAAPASGPATMDVRGWQDYCFEWLKAVDDDDEKTDIDVMTKWSGELALRNKCGVTSGDRQKLFEYMNAILEKKREAQAKRV